MAKSRKTTTKERHQGDSKERYGPSFYGSHREYVVMEGDGTWISPSLTDDEVAEINEKFGVVTPGRVICKDEQGFYLTYSNRLDNGLADSCRYNGR